MKNKNIPVLLSRWLKIAILVVLLIFSWGIVKILSLIKGKDWLQNQAAVLGINTVKADVPLGGSSGGGGGGSTPFLALWDGTRYFLENDFLFGKPRSYFSNFLEGEKEYVAGHIYPDLYKFQNQFKPKNGKISFQIQEIEPEESFLNGLSLIRVIHSKESDILVDADYRNFYVFNRKNLNNIFVKPKSVLNKENTKLSQLSEINNLWTKVERAKSVLFERGNYLDISFDGLNPGSRYSLVVKSLYRDWTPGDDLSVWAQSKFYFNHLLHSKILSKKTMVALIAGALWLSSKSSVSASAILPILIGECGCCGSSDSGSASGADTGGTGSSLGDCLSCGGSTGGSLRVFYKSLSGDYTYSGVIFPRALHPTIELLELPKESVSENGELNLRILITQNHYIDFVGLIDTIKEEAYQMEHLELTKAYHHRLNQNLIDSLKYDRKNYLHTIPGDIVDLEFQNPKVKLSSNQQESYIIRAAGFYTALSPESRVLAGRWEDKISEEARKRLSALMINNS